MEPFSVCLSVYKNDKAEELRLAIQSIIDQSCPPNEIVVGVDGPIRDDVKELLSQYERSYPGLFRFVRFDQNRGLGIILQECLLRSSYDLVARMDSDDIALPDRFEKQLHCFLEDPRLSIVGGAIAEFIDDPSNVVAQRYCPLTDMSIKRYMKSRCGLNHVTVMFRKAEVLRAGNYKDWFWNEDYYLWIRMMEVGCRFRNLPDVLVNVRVSYDMYARRGGMRYFRSELKLQQYMRAKRIISFPRYCYNVMIRWGVEVLIPNRVRGILYRNLFREKR